MGVLRIRGWALSAILLSSILLSSAAPAQAPARRGGLFGDWRVKMSVDGRDREAILAFSRDEQGQPTGRWISFWGVSELADINFADGKLSFVRSYRDREGQTVSSKFAGSVVGGKLTGSVSSERGEAALEGARSRPMPRAVGSWTTKFTIGDREITNTLVITAADGGALAVDWRSDRVKHEISDVRLEQGKLTFKTKSAMDDRKWESTFEATFEGNTYSGVVKSERGDTPVKGERIGGELIGTWNLDIASDRGERKQRLRVFPDMSGLFGATPVKEVRLQEGKVSFKVSMEFGDQTFELSFQGKLDGNVLNGELTTSRGAQKVTGEKAPRPRRAGRRGAL